MVFKRKLFSLIFAPILIISSSILIFNQTSCSKNEQAEYFEVSVDRQTQLTLKSRNSSLEVAIPNVEYKDVMFSKWKTLEKDESVTLEKDHHYQLRGNNKNGFNISVTNTNFSQYGHLLFENGQVSFSGSIMSLIDANLSNNTTIPNNFCFYEMFKESDSIVSISDNFLPTINLKQSCYESMFDSCFNLVKGPQLPATTLFDNCYTSMFDNSALKKCNWFTCN